VTQWFDGPLTPADVVTFFGNKLLTTLRKWEGEKKSPVTQKGAIQTRAEPLVMFVTHFIFVVTDWLQDPARWDALVTDHDLRYLVRTYVATAINGLFYTEDPEMWLELIACHHALFDRAPWPSPPGHKPPDMSAVIERLKRKRFKNDIIMHSKFLWVWFRALRAKAESERR
jgi:hypothetical protein